MSLGILNFVFVKTPLNKNKNDNRSQLGEDYKRMIHHKQYLHLSDVCICDFNRKLIKYGTY